MDIKFGEFQFAVAILKELSKGIHVPRAAGKSIYIPSPYEEKK